jgi:hypothetical protein
MQVQPGFSMLQALSTALQPPTARTQQGQTVQPVRPGAPAQKDPSLAQSASLPQAGVNMNAPRGTYLNIRV